MQDFLTSHFTDEQLMMGSFYALMLVIAIAFVLLFRIENQMYDDNNELNKTEE